MDERTRWYKDKCFYYIYIPSFQDGNEDGLGDLHGVLNRLDYIASLHVDGIWLSPPFPCKDVVADNGRSMLDFCDIASEFGGMPAFQELLDAVHLRGMKLLMDLPLNCTSDTHPWFSASVQGEKPYKYYYIWRPSPTADKKKRPNNWLNMRNQSAWAWNEDRNAFYLHLWGESYPELNMRNPAVRKELKQVMSFWLDMGVDGFSQQGLSYISKPKELPDGLPLWPYRRGQRYYNRGPFLRSYMQEFRHEVLDKYPCMVVGDLPGISSKEALQFSDEPDGELDMVRHTDYMGGDRFFGRFSHTAFSLLRQKYFWNRWQKQMEGKGWNLLYLESSAFPRSISRYGSEKRRSESGKSLAAAFLFQQGTPVIYQGQEIGMTNIRLDSIQWYRDQDSNWIYRRSPPQNEKKRLERVWAEAPESSRTTMQWDKSQDGGFTACGSVINVNQNYRSINVAGQERDENSLLQFYRKALELRRELGVICRGSYKDLQPLNPWFYVYERANRSGRMLVMCSFSDKARLLLCPRGYELHKGKLLLQSHGDELEGKNIYMKPYECRVYWFPGSRRSELDKERAEKKAMKKTTRLYSLWKGIREYFRSFREFYDDFEEEDDM